MTIRYRNTFGDIMAFCFYHYPRSPLVVGIYGIGFIVISLSVVQALPGDRAPVVKVIAFVILESVVFIALAGFFSLTVVLSMVSRRNKTLLTDHTITLADGAFTEETAYNKSDHKWAGVQKIARSRRHIFIYVAQHAAHVIPRRAFRDDREWDSFYGFCRERTEAIKRLDNDEPPLAHCVRRQRGCRTCCSRSSFAPGGGRISWPLAQGSIVEEYRKLSPSMRTVAIALCLIGCGWLSYQTLVFGSRLNSAVEESVFLAA